ncbi:MAG: hypothetical protein M0T77_01770 [Actinomycetota bacterium]|nr:hypothetical protein [Actinomycetota bacterium]
MKDRLATVLGEEVAAEHPEHSIAAAAANSLRGQVEQLTATGVEWRRELRNSQEELEADRRLNLMSLMRAQNGTAPAA